MHDVIVVRDLDDALAVRLPQGQRGLRLGTAFGPNVVIVRPLPFSKGRTRRLNRENDALGKITLILERLDLLYQCSRASASAGVSFALFQQ